MSTPPASANSTQISSLTARRLTAPHTAAATSGPATASPRRCRMASSAPGAPALASVRPFWKALPPSSDNNLEFRVQGLLMHGQQGVTGLAKMRPVWKALPPGSGIIFRVEGVRSPHNA